MKYGEKEGGGRGRDGKTHFLIPVHIDPTLATISHHVKRQRKKKGEWGGGGGVP